MAKREPRVPIKVDSGDIKTLPDDEIALILRGADELIMRGGRTLLAKVLRGSREKKIIDLGLDQSPAYGALRDLRTEQIMARIDWLIRKQYLGIEYDGRLPLLVYRPRGWEIERATFTAELLARVDESIAAGASHDNGSWLAEYNREVIMALLDQIEASGDPKYIPALEGWTQSTPQKIRARIRRAIAGLKS